MIRPASADDAAAIAVLERELFGGEAWSAGQVAEELTGFGRRGWVVRRAGAAAAPEGYLITRTVGDVSDLQRIGVAPACQRGGLAATLLAHALAAAAADGAERMLLEVAEANAAARHLYARAGFVEIDRRRGYYRHGVDALVLERRLDGVPPTTGEAE